MNNSKFKSALDKFKSHVVIQPNGCWYLNLEPMNSNGYSQFTFKNKNHRAHVFAYSNLVGFIPYGMQIHHKCEIKRCCNPDHLEMVSSRDHLKLHPNNLLSINAAKTHCINGHEYTKENTYWERKGRQCKTCRQIRGRNGDPKINTN